MSKKSKYTKEQKYEILKELKLNELSVADLCVKFKISHTTVRRWKYLYNKYGIEALEENKTCKIYPSKLKEAAVLEYLNGGNSLIDICRKYRISSGSVLERWIKRYNSHNKLKTSEGGGDTVMIKGRKSTLSERIEVAKYCINHNKDYNATSKIYNFSYHQVYRWVKKYEELGEDGLVDLRGKKKLELSQEDKIKVEMKELKKSNERLKMENDFLKKLQELERGDI